MIELNLKVNVQNLPSAFKRYLIFLYDLFSILVAFALSIYLKFTGLSDLEFAFVNLKADIALIVFIQFSSFCVFGLYKGIWRFSSIHDLYRVIKGVTFGVCASLLILFLWNRALFFPRTIFFIDWFILLVLVGGGRFFYRFLVDYQYQMKGDGILIYGAGANGEKLLREIRCRPSVNFRVLGFIDDNTNIKKSTIHGVSILGSCEVLESIVKKFRPKRIIISTNTIEAKKIQLITTICMNYHVEISIVPPLNELIFNKKLMTQVRKVSYEDLLGRESVQLDRDSLGRMIKAKVVLVTGAGGSIGSELCYQLAKFQPQKLILYEKTEFFLYQLDLDLREKFQEIEIVSVIGDVLDQEKVGHILNLYSPHLIFHAAAYKHVPLMEKNAQSAIINNVKGTYIVANEALKNNVEKFVLISSDKAVNPTNIMGATKRMAEIICQNFNLKRSAFSGTQYITVRFGNVLGSSGSVIPRFKKQIDQGGPITVTHPEIKRYFMSIPEACLLVLEAADIGMGGEIFVLDMGEPVKIFDLAQQMILLSGLTPHKDIDIIFTGLRPGEKLYEELFTSSEVILPTKNSKVKVAKHSGQIITPIAEIMKLINVSSFVPIQEIRELIQKIIPEYQFGPSVTEEVVAASHLGINDYHSEKSETIINLNEQSVQ